MLNRLQFNFLCFLILILVLLAVFIFEVFYFLPSPTGDDLWFLKLSFNICRTLNLLQQIIQYLNFTLKHCLGLLMDG